jgi:hypothetical protein
LYRRTTSMRAVESSVSSWNVKSFWWLDKQICFPPHELHSMITNFHTQNLLYYDGFCICGHDLMKEPMKKQ